MDYRDRALRETARAGMRSQRAVVQIVDDEDPGSLERALAEIRRARSHLVLAEDDIRHAMRRAEGATVIRLREVVEAA